MNKILELTMRNIFVVPVLLCAGLAVCPAVFAHNAALTGTGTVAAAFLHPFTGLDHLAAMLVVGVWAARVAGMALALPLAFVLALAVGALLGVAMPGWTGAERGIALSLIALGLVVALALELPRALVLGLCSACAVVHGHAHGRELLLGAPDGVRVVLAFVLASAFLHALGYAAARAAGGVPAQALRVAAAVLAGGGAWLLATT